MTTTQTAAIPRVEPIRLRGASKMYGHAGDAVPALDAISLDVEPGEFVCLLGASGCGKSTLLNLVAGLDRATAGTVDVRGRTSLMFQEAALLELLGLVHLEGFERKLPHELSGGMRQRVQLARALAQGADILLMDEPFGALDAMTRDLLHDEIERLWKEQGLTILFVTHNVREAVRLGDRVVLLSSRAGRVVAEFAVEIPRPRRIESHPVADLASTITARLREEVRRHGDP